MKTGRPKELGRPVGLPYGRERLLLGLGLARALGLRGDVRDRAYLTHHGTDNRQAYLKFIRGEKHFLRYNADGFMLARQFFEEAIVLDPEYPDPYI